MNDKINKILFALLRSSVCSVPLSDEEKLIYTSDMLPQLEKISKLHDSIHLLAYGLKKNNLLDDNSKAITTEIYKAVYRYEQQKYAYNQVCGILEKSEIPFIPLKGVVLRKYYPEPWMRTSCDIDILICEKDAQCSLQALYEAGYIKQGGSIHDYGVTSPNNVHIELHYKLSQDGEFTDVDEVLNKIWYTAIPTENSKYLYRMQPEIFLLYHLVHMGRHLLHGGCGIRPFIDLWLIENKMSYDKNYLKEILSSTGLLALYEIASDLSKVWLENKMHTEQTRILEEYILFGGVYGNAKNSAQVKAAKGVGKAKSFLSLMFLPRANLEVIYPSLKKHPCMLPFYQIMRWFRFFNKRKRDKIKYLTKTRNTVSKANTDITKIMLEHLGLLNK